MKKACTLVFDYANPCSELPLDFSYPLEYVSGFSMLVIFLHLTAYIIMSHVFIHILPELPLKITVEFSSTKNFGFC